jgi:antirestriction protein ArdC
MAKKNQRNLYKEVTARIVKAMEAGPGEWIKPWAMMGGVGGAGAPRNGSTGKKYRGINIILLGLAASGEGYTSPLWYTYKQASAKGGQVRKGEKGTPIVFWLFRVKCPHCEEWQPKKKKTCAKCGKDLGSAYNRPAPSPRSYTVFNQNQCDGLGTIEEAPRGPSIIPEGVEELNAADLRLQAIIDGGCKLTHGGNRACYNITTDAIKMPKPEQFKSRADYHATAFHELAHWTGHTSRLGRDLEGRFGDASYAMEELIAELSAAFSCADLGVEGKLQHPEYLASWIKVLKNDDRAIFTAASKATKATDYLIDFAVEAESAAA